MPRNGEEKRLDHTNYQPLVQNFCQPFLANEPLKIPLSRLIILVG